MCGCLPYHAFVVEDTPKEEKKKQKKDEWVIVPTGNGVAVWHGQPTYTTVPQPVFQPQQQIAHLAQAPPGPQAVPWFGPTRAKVVERSVRIASNNAGNWTLVPQDANPGQHFWVKEKDGSWNLHSFYNIMNHFQPGEWQKNANAIWFVRK